MAKKYLYHCKYPMKGSSWHVVEASSMKAARIKFTKGSRYNPEDVKCKRYKGKKPTWMK